MVDSSADKAFVISVIRNYPTGYLPNEIVDNRLQSDYGEQYVFNQTQKQPNLYPIGSIIFTLLPLKVNDIGTIAMNGYVFTPLIDVQ